ncbi:MAG: GreA/GreB family elongation factor [Spirochaetes bacterium]|nr:GreA/GreB family elongation factor [Spirochaetota bacterium]
MEKEKTVTRLESLFKEEVWGRMSPKDIGVPRFKILEDFFNNIVAENMVDVASEECKSHLKTNGDSVTAKYILGLIAYNFNRIDDKVYFKFLIDLFLQNSKWAVVEHLAEKILEFGENRHALKALGTSLERLKRQKEAIPVWEELLKLDRFDAEVAKRLSVAVKEDDPEKSIQYVKLAIEGFIKSGKYEEIEPLWTILVDLAWDDIAYFERIERQLSDAQQTAMLPDMLKKLNYKYEPENTDISIEILKKIIKIMPDDPESRKHLIKMYEQKYGNHSQFQQFMQLSGLGNFKKPAAAAIKLFENNIVFEKDNYVFHRSWGLGQIQSIDNESIVIDFPQKKDHKMSVQMALNSLQPVGQDHFYVRNFLDPQGMKDMFKNDFISFFKMLVRSYGENITAANLKNDLIPDFVELKNWAKWWSKTKTIIKKDPELGISDLKKDVVFLREKPVSFSDELINRFNKSKSFSEKLTIGEEFSNNVDESENSENVEIIVSYFENAASEGSNTKLILSYFLLSSFVKYSDKISHTVANLKKKVIEFIKTSSELIVISQKITSYDNKKEYLNLIQEVRKDWQDVYSDILFELPVRIHRYIINRFIQEKSFAPINNFLEKIILNAKEYPDIFLYAAKNIFSGAWDYPWLEYSRNALVLSFFRILREIKKVEQRGSRLRNNVLDILFADNEQVLRDIIKEYDEAFLNKLYDMSLSSDFFEESQLEKIISLIRIKYPDYIPREIKKADDSFDDEELYVLQSGYDSKVAELNDMLNVELPKLQKELSSVSDVSADLRENVDFNALVEKQAILKKSISTLDMEIKSAKIIDLDSVKTDVVSIGTIVTIEIKGSGEDKAYSILGPWDVNFEDNILSYRSRLAKQLMGRKTGDEVTLKIDEGERIFIIKSIEKYS